MKRSGEGAARRAVLPHIGFTGTLRTMAESTQGIVVCEQCDAAHRWRALHPDEVARCSRCGAVLGRGHRLGVDQLLALTLTALVVFIIALLNDLASLHLQGHHAEATLPAAIAATWSKGAYLVAIAAAATAIVAPALLIALRLYLLVPMHFGRIPRHFGRCMRLLHELQRWNMVEVLMVAALVSIVKMMSVAQSTPGIGMWAFGVLALIIAGLESGGLRHLWLQ
jgi:paraquat-inducible protein A